MKLFTCTNFRGQYPVPTAAVIYARDCREARQLLMSELMDNHNLDYEADEMAAWEFEEIARVPLVGLYEPRTEPYQETSEEMKPFAKVLSDGEY